MSELAQQGRPVLGRPSPASDAEPVLRSGGESATAGWRADAGSTSWCRVRAASVVGVRHRLAGQPVEDSYAWGLRADGVVLAVADGVGTVPGSAGAAERACRAAVAAALDGASDDPQAVLRGAFEAGNGAAEGGGATTLLVAMVTAGGRVTAGRIGDSSAFVLDEDGTATELFDPPDPDRADTATDAVPTEAADPETRTVVLARPGCLILATDGLADPWRDGPTTVAPALALSLRNAPDPLQLLALTDFSRQGCHDDRTVVGVWLVPET